MNNLTDQKFLVNTEIGIKRVEAYLSLNLDCKEYFNGLKLTILFECVVDGILVDCCILDRHFLETRLFMRYYDCFLWRKTGSVQHTGCY